MSHFQNNQNNHKESKDKQDNQDNKNHLTTIVQKFTDDVLSFIDNSSSLVIESPSDVINTSQIEGRELLMRQLSESMKKLTNVIDTLNNTCQQAAIAHNKDLISVNNIYQRLKLGPVTAHHEASQLTPRLVNVSTSTNSTNSPPNDTNVTIQPQTAHQIPTETDKMATWTVVPHKRPPSRINSTARSYANITQAVYSNVSNVVNSIQPNSIPLQLSCSLDATTTALQNIKIQPIQQIQTTIKFTENLSLNAISVNSWDDVPDVQLYYVKKADHFAVRINGHLLHGNIGLIYTEEKSPEKIKDCKFASNCMKQDNCDYYHDPLIFPNSNDVRNYIAGSYLYAPPDSHYKNRPRSRRFGSKKYLDVDYAALQEEEASRFCDQAMQDLLCSLLLKQKL